MTGKLPGEKKLLLCFAVLDLTPWAAGAIPLLHKNLTKPMPYCLRWNFMPSYETSEDPNIHPPEFNTIYPFDEEFGSFCFKHAESAQKIPK